MTGLMSATGYPIHSQSPDAEIDYSVSAEDFIAALPGDTITAYEFTADRPAVELYDPSRDGDVFTIWVKNVARKTIYLITLHLDTAQGRHWDFSFRVAGKQT